MLSITDTTILIKTPELPAELSILKLVFPLCTCLHEVWYSFVPSRQTHMEFKKAIKVERSLTLNVDVYLKKSILDESYSCKVR